MGELVKLMHFAPFLFEQRLFINQTESKLTLPLLSICKEDGLWEAGCAGTGREVLMDGIPLLWRITTPGGELILINLFMLGMSQFIETHFWSRQRMRSFRSFSSIFAVG